MPPADSIYAEVVAYGRDNVFILSAGWGLVRAGRRLPQARSATRRRKLRFEDFAMLPTTAAPILFLGGTTTYRRFAT